MVILLLVDLGVSLKDKAKAIFMKTYALILFVAITLLSTWTNSDGASCSDHVIFARHQDTLPSILSVDRPIQFRSIVDIYQTKLTAFGRALPSTASCTDNVTFTTAKATANQILSINNSTSARSISQYFDAPQSLSVLGFDFFAYKVNATGGISMNVAAELYLAGPRFVANGCCARLCDG